MVRRIGLLLLFVALAGCASDPKITVTADASITGRTIDYWKSGDRTRYGTIENLRDELLKLPPPPPNIRIIPGTPGSPGTPGMPGTPPIPGTPSPGYDPAIYGPLLSFLNAGPNGNRITLAHLQQITPTLFALAQVYASNPNVSLNQLISSPQGAAFLAVAQSILQPLGLWNITSLNQWYSYAGSRFGTLRSILFMLYNKLLVTPPGGTPRTPGAPGTPGTPGTPGAPDQYIVTYVNPYTIAAEIVSLFKRKDWLLFAERAPKLADTLLRFAGVSTPRVLLYGSRGRLYAPGVIAARRVDKDRYVYVLNQEGFFINEQASGAGLWYQGPDDISLVYVPIKVENGKVDTPDVIASDLYALLKRSVGGNLDLLDRASTHSTGLLKANIALGEQHNYSIGVALGTTPFASVGGMTGEIKYDAGLLTGRIGLGFFAMRSYDDNSENAVAYLDTEHTLRTPYLTVKNEEKTNSPEFKLWGSLTLSAAGMASYSITPAARGKKDVGNTLGGQGDGRLIPEIHTSLDTVLVKFELYGGMTCAVAPYGDVDLDSPAGSLRLIPIRAHIGGAARLKLTSISTFVKAQQDEAEAEARGKKPPAEPKYGEEWLYLSLSGVTEISRLFRKSRLSLTLDFLEATVGFVSEFEHYLDEDFSDIRLGGLARFMGFYVRGLKSIKDEDYRLDAGFEWTF